MIPRYSRPEMSSIWTDEYKLSQWLEVETCALEEMAKVGLAPETAARAVRERGKIDAARAATIESEIKHDVIAFLTAVSESVGPEARHLHRGMTSNDLLDTAFGLICKKAGDVLLHGLAQLRRVILNRAEEFKMVPCVGRSHGIHGEPMSFGVKLISWYAELGRAERRIQSALKELCVGKIAGAVGTFASIPPHVERKVLSRLGLGMESVPSQIVQRDRHAAFLSALALMASSIERAAVELRHLQRTEVREAEEFFSAKQKGSSAMPHKRNPISAENITGLARLIRSYVIPAHENVPLWHERDISHSSVERVIFPDAFIAADYMIHRFKELIEGLVVYPDRMQKNLESTRGLVFSGSLLIALTDAGMERDEAYRLVQKHALAAWDGGLGLFERVSEDPSIVKCLNVDGIKAVFDLSRHLAHVDYIFDRAKAEG
jgi:adenylosuccinate lyase